jgi:hypothetical protein
MGAILQELFREQMNFVFFFRGLAFFLVLAVTFIFQRNASQRLPWGWFRLFAGFQGIASWSLLASVNFGNSLYLFIGGEFFQIVSWMFLVGFGRFGIKRVLDRDSDRDSGLWLYALLMMLTALGGLKGWWGLGLTSRFALGLGGGLWASAVLFLEGRHSPPGAREGSLATGISLVLYSFSVALFFPSHSAPPGFFFTQDVLMKSTGVPLAFCQALLALGMVVGIYGFLSRHEAEEFPGTQYYSRYMVAMLTTLAIIMVLGSGLTIFLGDWAVKRDHQVKAEAQRLANNAVRRLNSEFNRIEEGVMALAKTRWLPRALRSPDQDGFEDINALLDRCRKKLDASVCYVLDGNGETVASSNRDAPESFVGKNYAGRPSFKQAINGKGSQYFAMGATPGYYVSYPIRDPRRKNFIAVAVVQVTLTNIFRELQSTGEKDNCILCLVDPKGVVFLSSQPDMILASLWPVAEKDRFALGEHYGKDRFTAVFPENIGNGSKVDYKGRPYLVSIAETIHAGWSVFVFRPIEPMSSHRLIGIAVAFLLALALASLLALIIFVVLGASFCFNNPKAAWAGRFRAIFNQT